MAVIYIDIDGVICTNTDGKYELAEPIPFAVETVNAIYDAGHEVILWTARGTTTGIDWKHLTQSQLEKWGVRYTRLSLGKPYYDHFVDDRALSSLENLTL